MIQTLFAYFAVSNGDPGAEDSRTIVDMDGKSLILGVFENRTDLSLSFGRVISGT